MKAAREGQYESTEFIRDVAAADSLTRFASSLGIACPPLEVGDPIPILWHWALFLPTPAPDGTDTDGHPIRGTFLPEVPQRRRVFAGSVIRLLSPVRVGMEIERTARVASTVSKVGRSGPVTLVKVQHEVRANSQTLLTEEQSLAYTDSRPTPPSANITAPPDGEWSNTVTPDEVMLFRFSAVTFNSHRIHYDQRFATKMEGHHDLVVQGPLLAVLLEDLLRQHHPGQVNEFRFRLRTPCYVGQPVHLLGQRMGKQIALSGYRSDGELAIEAEAEI